MLREGTMSDITIRGWIQLPFRQLLDRGVASGGLDGATQIDSRWKRVAEPAIEGISGWQDRFPFSLEAHWNFTLNGMRSCNPKIRSMAVSATRFDGESICVTS